MGITNRMKELTQNILTSTEERAGELSRLKQETKTLQRESVKRIKDFSSERSEAGRQLHKTLSQSNEARRKTALESRENAQNTIQEFRDSRRENGEHLRKELAQDSKLLSQNEKKRKQQVKKMMELFQKSRKETGAELRKDLNESKNRIHSDVKEALGDARELVNGFQSSRMTMAGELKNDLGKSKKERKANIDGMLQDYRKTQSELQQELKGASDAWRGMGSLKHKEANRQETVLKAKPEISVPKSRNLKEHLLTIIKQHRAGIRLSAAAKEMGVATVVLGKTAKALLDNGNIRKEKSIYFPVTT